MLDSERTGLASTLSEATVPSWSQMQQASDHARLAKALLERNSQAAGRAMHAHMTRLITMVSDYKARLDARENRTILDKSEDT